MTIAIEELYLLLEGQEIVISDCEGNNHHSDSPGCLCSIKGTVQTIGKKYESFLVGTPTWWLQKLDKRVRLSEITLIKKTQS